MKVVIVESPNKTHTIEQYLGKDYKVVASVGHIRELVSTGKDNLGLDFNNHLKPIYAVTSDHVKVVKKLNDAIKDADTVYLATDLDREGEAISWHLTEVLNLEGKTVKRIEFNEITKSALNYAIENPRDLDMNLVYSQEARRVIDRIIGYKLSNVIQKRLGVPSAGRVQSATLKMITDREKEINAFVPIKYSTIKAIAKDFEAKLYMDNKEEVYKIEDEALASKIFESTSKEMVVTNITKSIRKEYAKPPFETSTLLQALNQEHNFSTKTSMKEAQSLFEGIEINGKHIALITYMRTDETRLSKDFIFQQLKPLIVSKYGVESVGYVHTGKGSDFAQGAHEAIRPVDLRLTPESLKDSLTKYQYLTYKTIYDRTVQSMMKDAEIEVTKVEFRDKSNNRFICEFNKYTDLGYRVALDSKSNKEAEFKNNIGDQFIFSDIKLESKETEGPKRFSEAQLIKLMKEKGVGRPSTYAATIEGLKTPSKGYVIKTKNVLVPQRNGMASLEFLEKYFLQLVDIPFTAQMESELDEIAQGERDKTEYVENFYDMVDKLIIEKNKEMNTSEPLYTGELCPVCGSKMAYRNSQFGLFEACSNYPKCSYIKKNTPKTEETDIICPKCGKGHLVQKKGYKGKMFYGCSEYNITGCDYMISKLPVSKKGK